MNVFALANQAPVIALLWLTVQKPGIPSQRYGNSTPISQVNHECIVRHGHVLHDSRSHLDFVLCKSGDGDTALCCQRLVVQFDAFNLMQSLGSEIAFPAFASAGGRTS